MSFLWTCIPTCSPRGTELVTIRAWPNGRFEFSHFSDEELAEGLLAMSIVQYPGGRTELAKRIGKERAKPLGPDGAKGRTSLRYGTSGSVATALASGSLP